MRNAFAELDRGWLVASARIAAEHAVLRTVLRELRAASRDAALSKDGRSLRAQLLDASAQIARHLDFEDALGPPSAVARDHGAVRAALAKLRVSAGGARVSVRDLCDEIVWFSRRLEDEIDVEDRLLVLPRTA